MDSNLLVPKKIEGEESFTFVSEGIMVDGSGYSKGMKNTIIFHGPSRPAVKELFTALSLLTATYMDTSFKEEMTSLVINHLNTASDLIKQQAGA